MFDQYSQMSTHARQFAYANPKALHTWQDETRQSSDRDLRFRLRVALFEGLSAPAALALAGLALAVALVLSA